MHTWTLEGLKLHRTSYNGTVQSLYCITHFYVLRQIVSILHPVLLGWGTKGNMSQYKWTKYRTD